MKFEDLLYEEGTGKYANTLGISMPGGFWVFKGTMILAWKAVHENWANIDWTEKQCSETLIGSDVWHGQVNGAKRALGRCITLFAKHDMLPLLLAPALTRKGKPYKGGKNLYVLASTVTVKPLPVMKLPAARIERNKNLLARVDWAALTQTKPQITIGDMTYDCRAV